MKKILLEIKHSINKRIGNAIESISCRLYYHSKKNSWGHCLYAMNNMVLRCVSFVPFEVVSHHVYAKSHLTSSIIPLITNRVGYTSKLTYELEPLKKELISVPMQDIFIYKHEGVRIQGNSDFILNVKEKCVINDFCYNMNDRYVMFDGLLLRLKNNVAVLRNDGGIGKCRYLKSGIMLSGKFSCNYYHELYEILIKLLVFNRINISKDAPLIIDEIVMKIDSFKKIFEILNETQRDIITIGEKEIVEFGTLYSLSAVNSIAPHYRDITDPDHLFGFVFDCHLTLQMRDKLLLFKSNLATPKRIFLTRKSTKKRHYNEFEVWGVLKEYGFEVVAPETYTFCEQMALFNNADCAFVRCGWAPFINHFYFYTLSVTHLPFPAWSAVPAWAAGRRAHRLLRSAVPGGGAQRPFRSGKPAQCRQSPLIYAGHPPGRFGSFPAGPPGSHRPSLPLCCPRPCGSGTSSSVRGWCSGLHPG